MKYTLATIPNEALKSLRESAADRHPVSNLEQLGVSQRLINLLQMNGINEMQDLLLKSKEELLALSNFGERQLQILFEALSKYHFVEN
jgi:DNA-directed RNA polymerase alpha subunit